MVEVEHDRHRRILGHGAHPGNDLPVAPVLDGLGAGLADDGGVQFLGRLHHREIGNNHKITHVKISALAPDPTRFDCTSLRRGAPASLALRASKTTRDGAFGRSRQADVAAAWATASACPVARTEAGPLTAP